MSKKIFTLCLLGLASTLHAAPPDCKKHDFLNNGLNISNMQSCQTLFNACHRSGGLPDFKCANQIVNKQSQCEQLKMLSKLLQANPASLTIERYGKYIVLQQQFIADGQNTYYIISPAACMVNTMVDPRDLNEKFSNDYANLDLVITSWQKPSLVQNSDGTIMFTTILKINKGCLACETLGYATVNFLFSIDGKFERAVLAKFTAEGPRESS